MIYEVKKTRLFSNFRWSDPFNSSGMVRARELITMKQPYLCSERCIFQILSRIANAEEDLQWKILKFRWITTWKDYRKFSCINNLERNRNMIRRIMHQKRKFDKRIKMNKQWFGIRGIDVSSCIDIPAQSSHGLDGEWTMEERHRVRDESLQIFNVATRHLAAASL